jgi:hypothetical protein
MMICHGHVGPDCLDQLFLGYQAVRVFDEVTQDLEGLWTQFYLAICGAQQAPVGVKRVACKLVHRALHG